MDADIEAMVRAMPLPTEAERKRETLIGRLACAVGDMCETLPADHPVRRDGVHWKDREDFEQVLEAWEVSRNAAAPRPTG